MNWMGPTFRPLGMRQWAIVLYISLFCLGITLSCLVSGPVSAVVVADSDLSPAQLKAVAAKIGSTGEVEPDGFLPVRVRGSFASAARRLREAGIAIVLPSASRTVDNNSIKSVEAHLAYLRAKNELYEATHRHLEGEENEERGRVGFFEALKFYLERRVEADGLLDIDRWLQGARHREGMPKWSAPRARGQRTVGSWELLGPYGLGTPYRTYYGVPPLSGRKTSLAYAPSNPNIIYAAGGGGGVFKSTDGGVTFTGMSDKWPFLQCNAIAVDPVDPNIVYAGTGDYKQSAYAYGLMKTTDGGQTWTNYGAAQFGQGVITKIVIDPANRNTVLASVANTNRGVFRSTDAGVSWTQVLTLAVSIQDMDISANSGGRTWWAISGGNTVGGRLYNSTDGITWNQVTTLPGTATESRMDLACSKLNRDTVYVLATGAEQIYKTTNGGGSWVSVKNNFPNDRQAGDNYNWTQKTYDYHISTTTNGASDVVIVGLITVAASFDGGTNWVDLGLTYRNNAKTHNDQHTFANHPSDPNTILIGNDGGIFRCLLNPATTSGTFSPLNDKISDVMFYSIALHPTDETRLMGGTQDNATPGSRGNLSAWANLYAGDGCWCAFDQNNPGTHYTTSQGLSVYRYDTANDATPTGISPNWNAAFVAPLIVAGNGSELFAATTSNLQKYNGSGTSWTQSAQNISNGGTVTYLAAAPSNGSVIYSGANNGQVWRTPDEGATFVRIDGGLPDSGVGAIAVHPTNPNEVLVTVGNGGAVYRCPDTTAGTPTWTLVSGSGGTALPSVPVNALVYDPIRPTHWYAGTDLGAFISDNSGSTWANMNAAGLPNVMISDLEVNKAGTYLYAGTYGRGMWRVRIEQATYAVSGQIKQNSVGVPGCTVTFYQGTTPMESTTTDANGNYSADIEGGTYTIRPSHNDKVFFPSSRDITVPPDATAQNFTAGNIGPVSVAFEYPVVYSDQSRQATLGLNVETPVNRDITLSDNSLKLTSPVKVTVRAGQRTANFFVYGVSVTSDVIATVTATHQGLTATGQITVRAKPVLDSMTLAKSTTKGGYGVSGSVTIDKPAVGVMGLYLTSSNTDLAEIFPNPTAYAHNQSSKAFYCKTKVVTSTQTVIFTASFYGSTRTVPLELTP